MTSKALSMVWINWLERIIRTPLGSLDGDRWEAKLTRSRNIIMVCLCLTLVNHYVLVFP